MVLWGYYSSAVFTLNASVAEFSCLLVSSLESLPEKQKKKKTKNKQIESWGSVRSPEFSLSSHAVKKNKTDLFSYIVTCTHSEMMGWGERGKLKKGREREREVAEKEKKNQSTLICSAVKRNIRLFREWWVLYNEITDSGVSCFNGCYWSTFQCTLTEGSGCLRCLNYSAVVDIYRAGPCMKSHHSPGPGAISCSFRQAAVPVAAEVILAQSTQLSAVRVDT